jgi:hypothetical protein
MASVTVGGSINGTNFYFPTSTTFQIALAQKILSEAFSSPTTQLLTSSSPLTSALVVDIAAAGSLISGVSSIPSPEIALGGQNGVYVTAGATLSTVVAADYTNSSVVNDSPNGGLIAATGIGGNVLLGLAGESNFTTGTLGQDIVYLNGAADSLTSNGSDAVLVGGPSTVAAAGAGIDNVLMTNSTTLNFINGSAPGATDSITGAANGVVVLAGTGATSIMSATGPETFFIDTSAGNVTLNGNMQTTNTFEFVKNLDNATAQVAVNNFATGDAVDLHGYLSFNVTATPANSAGSVLHLSDGSQVSFNNLSAASLQQVIKVT